METSRVDIDYRPLRIGWVIHSSDKASLRKAMRYCSAFWGGRYNPVILVDRPEAPALVELYAPDFLVPLGDDESLAKFVASYSHLPAPLHYEHLFIDREAKWGAPRSSVLDIYNLFTHWRHRPEWKEEMELGVRVAQWAQDDPLADALLAQFGGYPDKADCGIDYCEALLQATPAVAIDLKQDAPIPEMLLQTLSISKLARFGIETHSWGEGWRTPGFYIGDAANIDDLVNYWNLRAAGISLSFHDPAHKQRYELLDAAYDHALRSDLASGDAFERAPAIWVRRAIIDEGRKSMGDREFILCGIDEHLWDGSNLRPCVAVLGQESSLGVVSGGDAPRISFALSNKPISSDTWFYTQHLMASIRLFGVTDRESMFIPPYVPELNEFYGREMSIHYDRLRIEHERIAFMIDAADRDFTFHALPVAKLFEQVFKLGGFKADLSSGGLITRQLMARMGGADGARAFKVPGVRRLLKQYGPNESFTSKAALQLIGGRDPANSRGSFADHKHLFIEPREWNEELTPKAVFAHLVAKGLFRIGADLKCPTCALTSWIPLDVLQQETKCQLCGASFDATRQLVEEHYAYRRSGVLGLERNIQGAVPVALVLQQLSVAIHGFSSETASGASYNLAPIDGNKGRACETDFVYLARRPRNEATDLLIGEVKDAGGAIDADDIENLRQVADSLPPKRFNTFIVLAKLSSFTEEEIRLASTLNTKYRRRVILLTDRELEPYHLYERVEKELDKRLVAVSADDMAKITHELFFQNKEPPKEPARP